MTPEPCSFAARELSDAGSRCGGTVCRVNTCPGDVGQGREQGASKIVATRWVLDKDASWKQSMKMDIQVQCRSNALNQGDCAGFGNKCGGFVVTPYIEDYDLSGRRVSEF